MRVMALDIMIIIMMVINQVAGCGCIIIIIIQLLEYPIPLPVLVLVLSSSVTKTVTWRYLGNREWYHRSAGVKTAVAWVTRPERPKDVKDEVKQARRAAT